MRHASTTTPSTPIPALKDWNQRDTQKEEGVCANACAHSCVSQIHNEDLPILISYMKSVFQHDEMVVGVFIFKRCLT